MATSYRQTAAALGAALNAGTVLFTALLIAASAASPGGTVIVPLAAGSAEIAAAIFISIAALALLPDVCRALTVSLAYHYCRCHFSGGSWRTRRLAFSLGVGCMFGASVTVLGAYLLAALNPGAAAGVCATAFGEALPELALFAAFGVPAAAYMLVKVREGQSERLAPFRWFYTHPRARAGRERRRALRSLFGPR